MTDRPLTGTGAENGGDALLYFPRTNLKPRGNAQGIEHTEKNKAEKIGTPTGFDNEKHHHSVEDRLLK